MFVCDCDHCGRRELRGPRSLHPMPHGDLVAWVAFCRGCGATVTIADGLRRNDGDAPAPAPAPVVRAA